MEKTIESLLNQIATANESDTEELCKIIESLNTCEKITIIINLGLYPSYAKLVYWKIRQIEKQVKNAA
jgi:hypothetical protein